jgi:hypothetical protein
MRSLHQQISEKCIHFTGVQNEKCEAGVEYKSFRGCPFPCFRGEAGDKLRKGEKPFVCEKVEWPTEEYIQAEIDMWERESKKAVEGNRAVAHIRKEQRGKNYRGVVECPICKGKLHVSHASNGHIHARCETPDCLAWME